MAEKRLSSNKSVVMLLSAAYMAVESYWLDLIASYALGRFWLSNVVFHLIAVFGAYILMDTILHRIKGSRRKRMIIAVAVLIFTIIVALIAALVMLYVRKLQLQS